MRLVKPAVLLAPVLLVLAACSSTVTVPQAEVEKQAIAQLTSVVGQVPDSLTCPGDLIAEVGTTMRCQLTSQGTVYGVTITVSSVADGNARFGVIVDDAPKGG
jgi:hypothetical protein